ncbi:MAG TPA: hypothetical protein VN428_18850 [Bryobacteraceae bacterium]|nr:hypothetical protein [Bryobacteraceae bacterium]
MKRLTGLLLGSSLLLGCLGLAAAQEAPPPPPKVLTIIREFVKPGRTGSMHEKTESAFVTAFAGAKWPQHYLAVDSMSGPPRSLFLVGYDSFEAWEKDNLATMKNSVLTSALERASLADSDMLASVDSGTFMYREDYSLRAAAVDIPHMRYFEISVFYVKPGHQKDWDDLVKMYMTAYEKISDTHWATFEKVYGNGGSEYLVFNPMKSLAETDRGFAQSKQFEAALGPEGMKKLSDLAAASIESSQTNLFMFNPRESYPSDAWVKADPDFWKPKPAPRK